MLYYETFAEFLKCNTFFSEMSDKLWILLQFNAFKEFAKNNSTILKIPNKEDYFVFAFTSQIF